MIIENVPEVGVSDQNVVMDLEIHSKVWLLDNRERNKLDASNFGTAQSEKDILP